MDNQGTNMGVNNIETQGVPNNVSAPTITPVAETGNNSFNLNSTVAAAPTPEPTPAPVQAAPTEPVIETVNSDAMPTSTGESRRFMTVGPAPDFARINKAKYINNGIESYFDGTLLEYIAYHFLGNFITALTGGVFGPWGTCIISDFKGSSRDY